jgi:DNA-directed RNA polymerase specialized sigma24 family protein
MNSHFNPKPVDNSKTFVFRTEPKSRPGLDEAASEMLKPGSGNSILAQYTSYLKKFNLQRKCDAAFVFNEAYLRACKALDAGKEISNYSAWMRVTGYNYVRELSRAEVAEKKTCDPSGGLDIDSIPAADDDLDQADDDLETVEQKFMRQAFATLSPLEQAILQLKVVEGRRWAEIQSTLVASGFPTISLNSLSVTKRRALLKLKANYLRIAA